MYKRQPVSLEPLLKYDPSFVWILTRVYGDTCLLYTSWYGDDTDGTDAKFAYKVGIVLEVPFANTNVWSFQTGLNFISKGVNGNGCLLYTSGIFTP